MKSLITNIFLFIVLPLIIYCQNGVKDTIKIIENDPLLLTDNNRNQSGIDLILTGGLGIVPGSTWGDWQDRFYTCPVITLGIEVPFTSKNYLSLEILSHFWVSKSKFNFDETYYYLSETYVNIDNGLYSQMGLSVGLKFLIVSDQGGKSDNVRLYGHSSLIFLSPKENYKSLDFGIGLQYIFNKKLSLYFDSRIMLNGPNLGGTFKDYVPNMFTANFCYTFNMVIK